LIGKQVNGIVPLRLCTNMMQITVMCIVLLTGIKLCIMPYKILMIMMLYYLRDILSGKSGLICQYKKKLNFDTIWSSMFDISGKRIFRAEEKPFRSKYINDHRLFA
jgi:hypothetical protein